MDAEIEERADGTKIWYLNGKRHREDGPAVEWTDGTKIWYLNGNLHREDGPAVEWSNGTKEWWINGFIHRKNGPAVERPDGTKEWWIKEKYFPDEASYWEFVNRTKDLVWQICSRNLIADPGFANYLLKFVL